MANKLLTGFSGMTDTKLRELGSNVKEGMVGNPHFTTLQAMIEAYLEKYTDYETAIPRSNERSQVTVEIKNAKRAALIPIMKKLALSVMVIADEDREILFSSGFELSKPRGKKVLPEAPKHVEAFATNDPDTIMVRCKGDKNVAIYKARVSTDKKDWRWTNERTSCKLQIQELPLGVILYVQMCAKNSAGESVWSDTASIRLPLPDEPELRRMRTGDSRK